MNCEATHEFLDQRARGATALPGGVAEHLGACPSCRALFRLLEEGGQPRVADVPAPLLQRIERQLTEKLRPVSPLPPVRTLALGFLLMFLLTAAVMTAFLGTAALRVMSFGQVVAIAGLIAAGAVWLAVSVSIQMAPGSAQPVPPSLVIACLLGGFAFGMAVLFPWGSTQRFFSRGVSCSAAGLIVALPAAVLLWLLARRGAVLAAGRLGASIGLLAGLVGAAVLQAYCPLLEAEHMTVWHSAIPAVSTAAGYACGRLAGQPRDCTAETRRHREK